MKSAIALFRSLLGDQCGATAIEYAMIAAGILLTIVGIVTLVGGEAVGLFSAAASAASNSMMNAGS